MSELGERLVASRAAGDPFPDFVVGTLDLRQALDLQLEILEHRLRAGEPEPGGWKVGLTSDASRQRLGADERPFGYVLAERVLDSGATLDSATVAGLSIEAEMCFTIGTDIGNTDITPDEIFDYVTGVSAGFELNEARTGSNRPDFYAIITDCLTNWGIVAGPPSATPTGPGSGRAFTDTTITMERNGEIVFQGVSADHVDAHAESLCRLVVELARHGRMLRAGQRVITGAFARFPAEAGDHWRADFGGIGAVDIKIT